jgi:hypothetical protein
MEQKLILITLCLAGAPLLTALTLFVVTTMRKRQAERAEEARRLAAAQDHAGGGRAGAMPPPSSGPGGGSPARSPGRRNHQSGHGQKDSDRSGRRRRENHGRDGPCRRHCRRGKTRGGGRARRQTADKPAEEGVSDAMQSLLSDVFADDEAGARLDRLLVGVADVAIDDLADLARSIAAPCTSRWSR